MKKQIFLSMLIFISVFLHTNTYSQTNILFTSYLIRDDNTYKNRSAQNEWINNTSFLIGHKLGGESFQLQGYYNADFLLFNNNTDLNNNSHKFGLNGTWPGDDLSVIVSAYYKKENFKELLNYYNVQKLNLGLNLLHTPDLANSLTAGIEVNRESYLEFSELDNISYKISGMYQKFFQSKLSVTAQANVGLKNYINQTVINYFGSVGGLGRMLRYQEDPIQSTIFSISTLIGKSISPSMGISLGLGGQWFLGDPIQSYSNGIYYYTESDLFDDPFSYQDKFVSLQLTNQFDVDFQGKIGVKFQTKDYLGTPALDNQGNLTNNTREDTRREYFLMVTKKFETSWTFPSSVSLFFNFMFRENPSNDPYYDFDDHVFLLGFAVGM